jgi:hypothetical protein
MMRAEDKKARLGERAWGKEEPKTSSFLISSFSLPFLLPYLFPSFAGSLGVCVQNHNLWSRTALPQYVVGFGLFVKKNIGTTDFSSDPQRPRNSDARIRARDDKSEAARFGSPIKDELKVSDDAVRMEVCFGRKQGVL